MAVGGRRGRRRVKPPKSSAEDAPVHRSRQHANVRLLTGCVTLPPRVFKRGQQFHLTPQMLRGRVLNLIGVLAKVQGGGRLTTSLLPHFNLLFLNSCFRPLINYFYFFFPKSVFLLFPSGFSGGLSDPLELLGRGAGLFVK